LQYFRPAARAVDESKTAAKIKAEIKYVLNDRLQALRERMK
jgi:hypothetical protein